MTTETAYLKPGEKWHPDATFDPTLKLAMVPLSDEVTRRVRSTGLWQEPGDFTDEHMHGHARRAGAPDTPVYLAEYQENEPGYSYLDYNGHYSRLPVNQTPYVQKWEPHLCTMAHDTDQFNIDATEFRKPGSYKDVPLGVHSAETQIRNQNTLQVFRAMIGDALRRLDAWSKLAPEGTDSFTTDWGQQLEGIRAIIEDKVCQTCEHPFSAREFARLHDYSAWRTILDHRRVLDDVTGSAIMRVPTIVRDTEPWQPHATENLAFFGGTDLETGWRTAIEWYDEAVHRYDRLYAPRYAVT